MGSITAGDEGATIAFNAGGFSLTGCTCTAIGVPGDYRAATTYPPANAIALGAATVEPDGLLATYTTTGTDITVGGDWTFWLRIKTPSGQSYTSQPDLSYILPGPGAVT